MKKTWVPGAFYLEFTLQYNEMLRKEMPEETTVKLQHFRVSHTFPWRSGLDLFKLYCVWRAKKSWVLLGRIPFICKELDQFDSDCLSLHFIVPLLQTLDIVLKRGLIELEVWHLSVVDNIGFSQPCSHINEPWQKQTGEQKKQVYCR